MRSRELKAIALQQLDTINRLYDLTFRQRRVIAEQKALLKTQSEMIDVLIKVVEGMSRDPVAG